MRFADETVENRCADVAGRNTRPEFRYVDGCQFLPFAGKIHNYNHEGLCRRIYQQQPAQTGVGAYVACGYAPMFLVTVASLFLLTHNYYCALTESGVLISQEIHGEFAVHNLCRFLEPFRHYSADTGWFVGGRCTCVEAFGSDRDSYKSRTRVSSSVLPTISLDLHLKTSPT